MAAARYERPPSTPEAVARELRHHLGAGTFGPGRRLIAGQIARLLGVSNQPVREALRLLEAEGQVEYRPNRGYTVTPLSTQDLLEVYRLRDLFEDEAVLRSMERFPPERLDELDELCSAVGRAMTQGDPALVRRANREFHAELRAANPYPRLAEVVEQLRSASAPYRARFLEQRVAWEDLADDHRQLVAAFRARDHDQVVAVSRRHRARTVERLLVATETSP